MRSPESELAALQSAVLLRSLRTAGPAPSTQLTMGGRTLVNFSSNDYLGLANSPELKTALVAAIATHGAGAGASRLVCGTLRPHTELEEALAACKGTEACLTFSSGYAAATGTLQALAGKDDILILDKLCHASLIDGARLSGARMRVFPHHDVDRLDHLLRWATAQSQPESRVIVVTESIFSMDGDRAPLSEIVRLKDQYGALLLLDEAHAFGIIGRGGRGLADELGLASRIDLHMGTLSKAAGLQGGYICAARAFIDLLINRARSFIYTTAPPPALAAAAAFAITQILTTARGDALRRKLWENLRQLHAELSGSIAEPASAIVPVIIGDEAAAVAASDLLLEQGFFVPAIRYPTVARGRARLRITLSAAHTADEVRALAAAVCGLRRGLRCGPT